MRLYRDEWHDKDAVVGLQQLFISSDIVFWVVFHIRRVSQQWASQSAHHADIGVEVMVPDRKFGFSERKFRYDWL